MIGEENDDRVFVLTRALQHVEYLADLLVDVGDIGEVAAARAAHVLLRDRIVRMVAGEHQPLTVGVLAVASDRRDGRVEFRAVGVEVPELPACDVGVVRVGEGNGQAPRPRVVAARQVVKLAGRLVGDLVVIFELVGDLGDAGALDRAQIVIPPVDALAGACVVGRPAEIGRIDVGRQPLLVAVQLVGPDEMHLARQRGLVAGAPEMMRIGRNVGGELRGVVVDASA